MGLPDCIGAKGYSGIWMAFNQTIMACPTLPAQPPSSGGSGGRPQRTTREDQPPGHCCNTEELHNDTKDTRRFHLPRFSHSPEISVAYDCLPEERPTRDSVAVGDEERSAKSCMRDVVGWMGPFPPRCGAQIRVASGMASESTQPDLDYMTKGVRSGNDRLITGRLPGADFFGP